MRLVPSFAALVAHRLEIILSGDPHTLVPERFLRLRFVWCDGYCDWSSLTFSLTRLGYPGGNAFETLNLFDFTGSIPSLLAQAGGLAVFSDLASGTIYSSGVYSAADIIRRVTQAITAACLSDMNAALGCWFAFVGAIANLTGGNPEKLFGASKISTVSQLTLIAAVASVPEPASVAFISPGLLGLGIKLRRQL